MSLRKEIEKAINSTSSENGSNTLSPAEALGVALSIPMSGTEMGDCQRLAQAMLEHLRKMGFELRRQA